MGWPKGRPRRGVEQGNSAEEDRADSSPTAGVDADAGFEDFMAACERARIADGVVLVALSHPDAGAARLIDGTYSGFRVESGPTSAKWSDGSMLP